MVAPATKNDIETLCTEAKTSGAAREMLIEQYAYLVRVCARPYYLAGADNEDLIQEGMLGLLSAIASFSSENGSQFSTYAGICIRRRMISAIRKANTGNQQLLRDAGELWEAEGTLPGPEETFLRKEETGQFFAELKESLSPLEKEILPQYLEGYSCREIAEALHRPEKSISNAIQRIRTKAVKQFRMA